MIEIILYAMVINWGVPIVVSFLFFVWLIFVSKDVRFEKYLRLWNVIPVFRFILISKRSWYARIWNMYYGQAMFLSIIHRDELGSYDDIFVEKTIVHEMRHVEVAFVLGLLMWILYILNYLFITTCTMDDPYMDNWFERDARNAVQKWIRAGRPRIHDFGKRY